MKTTIDLPAEVLREVKLRAVLQGRTVKELVGDLLRQGLGMSKAQSFAAEPSVGMVDFGEGKLPVIRCSLDAPATRMSVDELLAIEQQTQVEEDLRRGGRSV